MSAPGAEPLAATAATAISDTIAAWGKFQAGAGLDATWRLAREANELLSETEPWKLDPGPEVDAVLGDALEALRLVALLGAPAMPEAMTTAWSRLGLEGRPDEQVIGERWKPFERAAETTSPSVDRKAAAAQMAAFG